MSVASKSHWFALLICIGIGMAALGGEPTTGPDIIVGSIDSTANWGSLDGIHAYSVGTQSCNLGDEVVLFNANTDQHPVIGHSLFRVKDGRLEMIGMQWLKHGICALDQALCGTCEPTGCASLGVGCSNANSAVFNGQQQFLGPRSDVNAFTGEFPFPATNPPFGGSIDRRLQVSDDDIDPALNPGALYFLESVHIAEDDASAGNGLNNISHRPVTFGPGPNFNMSFSGITEREIPAIEAWEALDGAANIEVVDVPNEGRFLVGHSATDNGNGTWHYEFAVYNVNSHRSSRTFVVPVDPAVTISNLGFHDVDYHSGEPIDGTDWTATQTATQVEWATETFDQNADANSLRWSTLYNFRFDANAAPSTALGSMELFRAGFPETVSFNLVAPTTPGDLNITLTPEVTAVSPGDDLFYEVTVSNTSNQTESVDIWIDVSKPNGTEFSGNPIVGPKHKNLGPGFVASRVLRIRIPNSTPISGPYTVTGKVGTFPDQVTVSSSFQFDVVP